MPWRKDAPAPPGTLEFHLPGDEDVARHDDAWNRARAERLRKRHEHEE